MIKTHKKQNVYMNATSDGLETRPYKLEKRSVYEKNGKYHISYLKKEVFLREDGNFYGTYSATSINCGFYGDLLTRLKEHNQRMGNW